MAYDQYAASAYPAAAGFGAPPDPYAGAYGAPPAYPSYHPPPSYGEELRTIFITGFPADVKERELNNLLRFLPGYEASQMNWKNGQAQGFAMFANTALARAGCDAIAQLCFDETAVLRCEMARKNMYIKEDGGTKRPRANPPPGGAPGAPGGYGAPAGAPSAYGASAYGARPAAASYGRPVGYVPVTNTGDNPPCNTLFIGNLGDTTDENELRSLFVAQPGFRQLKLVRGQKATSCFVEFLDLPSAMGAHQSQQGAVLTSSDRGGIRIQYSKNPFGKKRDFGSVDGPHGSEYSAPSSYGGAEAGTGVTAAAASSKPEYTPAEYQPPGAEGTDPAAPGVGA